MSEPELSCPFCNARFPAPAGLVAGQRAPCPRCGETFVVRSQALARPAESALPASGAANTAASHQPGPRPTPASPDRSNLAWAAGIVGLMLVAAGVGLTYALLTQASRRANDSSLTKRPRKPWESSRPPEDEGPPATLVRAVAPARLAALGYLPPDNGLVLGVHVEELLQTAAGKALLTQPVRVADREIRLDSLLSATTLELTDIDHALLAMKPEEPLTVVLGVRTRAPYDGARLRSVLGATRTGDAGRPTYRLERAGLPIQPLLLCPDDRTLLLSLSAARLAATPARPAEGLAQVRSAARALIEERIGAGHPLWLAGQITGKDDALNLILSRLPKDDLERLKTVRTFGLWATLGDDAVTINAAVQVSDEAAARALEEQWLQPWLASVPAGAVVRDGAWLSVQARPTLAALRRALEK